MRNEQEHGSIEASMNSGIGMPQSGNCVTRV